MTAQEQQPVVETAKHMAEQAGDSVGQALAMAKQQTTSRVEAERERVAESLYTAAHALRQAGRQLREQEQGPIATLADRLAQGAEQASGYLRSRDLPQLIDDTEQRGREHPVLFAGAALGLGLLGVRFLKSSRRQQADATAGQPVSPEPAATRPNTTANGQEGRAPLPVADNRSPAPTDDDLAGVLEQTHGRPSTALDS